MTMRATITLKVTGTKIANAPKRIDESYIDRNSKLN